MSPSPPQHSVPFPVHREHTTVGCSPAPMAGAGSICVHASGKHEEERDAPRLYSCLGASWEEGKVSSSEWLCSLLDVFEKCRPGVHHRFEGVLAAGSHALIGVEQHGQLPIGFVHFVPRRQDKSEGTHATHSPAQSTAGPGAPPVLNSPV